MAKGSACIVHLLGRQFTGWISVFLINSTAVCFHAPGCSGHSLSNHTLGMAVCEFYPFRLHRD